MSLSHFSFLKAIFVMYSILFFHIFSASRYSLPDLDKVLREDENILEITDDSNFHYQTPDHFKDYRQSKEPVV